VHVSTSFLADTMLLTPAPRFKMTLPSAYGKTGQERQNQASRQVTKSASPSEKPRQA